MRGEVATTVACLLLVIIFSKHILLLERVILDSLAHSHFLKRLLRFVCFPLGVFFICSFHYLFLFAVLSLLS